MSWKYWQKGVIRKVVRFSNYGIDNVVNLGFGDKDLATGKIDDKVITDNGNFEKVLATVAVIIYKFTDFKPSSGY